MDVDAFTPGQFLKARATLETLSPDGQYFGYRAVKYGKEDEAYSAIAKAPYFTALAIDFHSVNTSSQLRFLEDGSLHSWGHFTGPIDRIARECPFDIVQSSWVHEGRRPAVLRDEARKRFIMVQGWKLVATWDSSDELVVLGSFEQVPFVAIHPPKWAKVW